ncbi:MAG: hypothetical protein K9L17_08065 [Clostridiales bacterium]|nr:hypothetical protein [Clostridiales bacterium]MCF8022629.1 hypothetical protein [Clostridiales bacterium]
MRGKIIFEDGSSYTIYKNVAEKDQAQVNNSYNSVIENNTAPEISDIP